METRMHGERPGPQRYGKGLACGLLAAAFIVIASTATQASPSTADVPRITKEEAKALLGAPKVVFLDGRITSAWYKSDKKIPGAVRADLWDFDTWADGFNRDTTFIVY